jgi:hypothetical protein
MQSRRCDAVASVSLLHQLSSVVAGLGDLSCWGGEVAAPPPERWAGPEGCSCEGRGGGGGEVENRDMLHHLGRVSQSRDSRVHAKRSAMHTCQLASEGTSQLTKLISMLVVQLVT